eukprot:2752860-Pyramimonas_sp.AAC.1
MAWAMHRMRTIGGWDPEQQYVPVRAPSFPVPQVTAVEHQLVRLDTGFMLCRSCFRSTAMESGPTLGQFFSICAHAKYFRSSSS